MNYTVTWTNEIEADSPREAAEKALEQHRDPNSLATVFQVHDHAGTAYVFDLPAPAVHTFVFETRQFFEYEAPAGTDPDDILNDPDFLEDCASKIREGTTELYHEHTLNEFGDKI